MFRKSVALAAAMILGASAASGFAQPAPVVTVTAPKKAKRGLFGGVLLDPMRTWGYAGPGTTMAQQQRASRKAKNVKRNRAAHRA